MPAEAFLLIAENSLAMAARYHGDGMKIRASFRQNRMTGASLATVLISRRDYNLVRLHKTLRVTPAMAAGVTDRAS